MIRTGKPGRMVVVGWTLSERPATCSPTWLSPCEKRWRRVERALVIVDAGFRTDAEQRREDRGLEQHAPMVVDLIFESSVPLRIGARLIHLPIDRLSTGSTLRMRRSC
jgi:hypothetical protein